MEIYDHPQNLFVATFIGSPAMNLFPLSDDGKELLFSDKTALPLPEGFRKAEESFYQERIAEVRKLLDDYDAENPKEAYRYLLENRSHLLTENMKPEAPKKEKKGFFHALALTLKAKKKAKAGEKTDYTRKELESRLAAYTASLTQSHALLAGIRCEDIVTERKEETDVPAVLVIEQIEVLGSEYILYGKIKNDEVKIKAQGRCDVKVGQEIPVYLRADKIHFFDPESGRNITGI
jgi:ABC-type sugar transport system ATPase subunit